MVWAAVIPADHPAEAGRDNLSAAGAASEKSGDQPQAKRTPSEADGGAFLAGDMGGDFGIAAVGLLSAGGSWRDMASGGGDGMEDIDRLIESEVADMDILVEDMRAEITARYAGFMVAARNSLPRDQIMGAIQVLKAQRNAELAEVKANAAKALQRRIKAVLEARRATRRPRPPELKH